MDEAQVEVGRFYAVLDTERQVVTTAVVTARTDSDFVLRTIRGRRFLRIKIERARYAIRRELTPDEVAACLKYARLADADAS